MASQRRGAVLFLTGPPGSGKTSTACLWALSRTRPAWPLEWDATSSVLREAHNLGAAGLPGDDETRYLFAARVMASQAEQIIAAGVDCIVVGAWALDWPGVDPWGPMAALDPTVCVLLPDVETAVRRNARDAHRQGDFAVDESNVRSAYQRDWRGWEDTGRGVVIDNSRLTPQETVDALEAAAAKLIGRQVPLGRDDLNRR